MKFIVRLAVLLSALVGLSGQSVVIAMVPVAVMSSAGHRQMPGMDCAAMSGGAPSGSMPCKKMTMQCMATMGCSTLTALEPTSAAFASPLAITSPYMNSAASRLRGRSYGPEPDPPSRLI